MASDVALDHGMEVRPLPPVRDSEGVWFVYTYDWGASPEALFATELEARRWSDENGGYQKVVFWPFGIEFGEIRKNG